MRPLSRIAGLLLALGLAVLPAVGQTQDFPTKPLRFIVANAAGTAPDLAARIMAQEMAKVIGQPIVVENKPGADQVIGYEYVAKSVPADGYTLVLVYPTALVTIPLTIKNLRFDPLKDLVPLFPIGEGRLLFGSNAELPWKNFKEFVAYAKANPGKLNYGSPSTAVRLSTEGLIRVLGLDIVHIPYAGAATYYQGVVSGQVHMGLVAQSTANSFKDRFRALAVTGSSRMASLPDVPTFTELGIPQIRGLSFSLHVPVGVPKPVFDRLHSAAVKTVQQPETRNRLNGMGLEPFADNSAESAAKLLADEAAFFAQVAKSIGIQPQ